MFGLFSARSHEDPVLGLLTHSRGHWRGAIDLGEGLVPLILAGNEETPGPAVLATARALAARYPQWQDRLRAELLAHYRAGAAARAATGAPPAAGLRPAPPASDDEVLAQASLAFACIAPHGGRLLTELGFSVAWEAAHMVGARFADERFVAFCGSTRKP